MTLTFDCWKKLFIGSPVDRLRAALIIIMVFAVSSFIVSSVVPQQFIDNLQLLSSIPAVVLTGIITALKVSH